MATDQISIAASKTGHYTTIETARLLGLAVRSVQLMVDRGELHAWKTAGGHRRITQDSVEQWLARHPNAKGKPRAQAVAASWGGPMQPFQPDAARVLLIEDSTHFQNLVSLLVKQHFPAVKLKIADDGIVGLAMVGQWQPHILIVDIMLPGIDGATLITSLRTHPQFSRHQLIVVTSLDEAQRQPYAFALEGVSVVHKPKMVAQLPVLLGEAMSRLAQADATV